MKKLILASILITLVALGTSCSKTTEEIKNESQIIGKWYLKRDVYKAIGSSGAGQTTNYAPNEYIQLESGGKATVRVDNKIYLSIWQLLDDGKKLFIQPTSDLDVPDDGYEIRTLTDNSLVLGYKELTPAPGYDLMIYLEK